MCRVIWLDKSSTDKQDMYTIHSCHPSVTESLSTGASGDVHNLSPVLAKTQFFLKLQCHLNRLSYSRQKNKYLANNFTCHSKSCEVFAQPL